MAARGRPSLFTPALAKRICERLAEGETLRSICRDDDMPSAPTVCRWALEEPFAEQYARAREIGYTLMADGLLEIADDTSDDTIVTEGTKRPNSEWINRSRLRVDTRKWLLSKCLPKIYGDKLALEGDMVIRDAIDRRSEERRVGKECRL